MGTPERQLSSLAKTYGGTRESYREESPQFEVSLKAFLIGKTPVTNALYAEYVKATGARAPITWHAPAPSAHVLDHPVVDVNWQEARHFCAWLSEQARRDPIAFQQHTGIYMPRFRLPSEAEWELAARGTDKRMFPWGNEWQVESANTRELGLNSTSPVGSYPQNASPYGCLDMSGNVWEWTTTLDALYPYDAKDGREDPNADGRRILRGGCYANPHGYARTACRFRLQPEMHNPFLGFRLACSA